MVADPASWAKAGAVRTMSTTSRAVHRTANFRNRLNSRIICLLIRRTGSFWSKEHQGENTTAFPAVLNFSKTLNRQHTRREA
jgi:hypothetical protein